MPLPKRHNQITIELPPGVTDHELDILTKTLGKYGIEQQEGVNGYDRSFERPHVIRRLEFLDLVTEGSDTIRQYAGVAWAGLRANYRLDSELVKPPARYINGNGYGYIGRQSNFTEGLLVVDSLGDCIEWAEPLVYEERRVKYLTPRLVDTWKVALDGISSSV